MPPTLPTTLLTSLTRLSLSPKSTPSRTLALAPTLIQTRHASHASQGVANGAKQGPGKRLGAKKGNTELVVPGNIIFRQRGTHWFAGENCVMGRDHTISALVKGYVRYYRDPAWGGRKFIGVVMDQGESLPRRHGVPRRRRLGMEVRETEKEGKTVGAAQGVDLGVRVLRAEGLSMAEQVKEAVRIGVGRRLKMSEKPDTRIRKGYQVRESDWSIGRTVEREGIRVREFKKNDRWAAWKKRAENAAVRKATRVSVRAKPQAQKAQGGRQGR